MPILIPPPLFVRRLHRFGARDVAKNLVNAGVAQALWIDADIYENTAAWTRGIIAFLSTMFRHNSPVAATPRKLKDQVRA